MAIFYGYETYVIDKDFILAQYEPETITLSPEGVEKDEYGNMYIHKGQFIDKDGKVITLTSGEGLEFSADPIGILTETKNLRMGPVGGSILRTGMIEAKWLYYPSDVVYDPAFNASIEEKLPGIKCRLVQEPAADVEVKKPTAVISGDKDTKFTVTYSDLGSYHGKIVVTTKSSGTDVTAKAAITASNPYDVTVKSITDPGTYIIHARLQEDPTDLATQEFEVQASEAA